MQTRAGDDAARAAPPRQKQGATGHESALRRQQMKYAILFIAPGLAVYLIFMVYPFLNTAYLSLTNWNGVAETKQFIGLTNYTRMLGDEVAQKAFLNNVIWVIIGTIAPVAIGLFEALLVWTSGRGSLFFRTLFFLPFVLPLVVVGIVWQWIYNPLFGIVNTVLDSVGLEGLSRGWLADPHTALYAVLIAAIWGASGFCFLILHASLQSVDMSTVEASMIDGANWFQRAWNIIIPQIAPQLTMVTTVTLIGGFSVFDIIFVMTGAGPGHASEVLATYTYKAAFQQNEAGYGSALAMVITALSLVSAVIFVRLRERQR
ncbi:MAG: sugar ABC transporter permease [Chloroflexota bacterium]|nr:sugar ABC transporter permease [Actinomycetota bacterium]MDQ5827312.1 sugar ABC transporter permease [Chloroflexota bacterium]